MSLNDTEDSDGCGADAKQNGEQSSSCDIFQAKPVLIRYVSPFISASLALHFTTFRSCNSSSDSSSDDASSLSNTTSNVPQKIGFINAIFKANPVAAVAKSDQFFPTSSALYLQRNLTEMRQKVHILKIIDWLLNLQFQLREEQSKQELAFKCVFSAQQQRPLATACCVNDSSTVTEASSSSGETTPHVSRESSRANDYKGIAKSMFGVAESSECLKYS